MPDYKKYKSYRETEIPWVGQIPSQWQLVLLSQVVTQVKNKNTVLLENNLLSLSYGRIKRKPIDSSGGLLPESFNGYNIIEENDIVLRLTDLQNDHTSLRVGISPEKGIITSAYTTMRPRNSSCAKYLFYLLYTFDIRKGFYGMGSGVRQGLNYDEVKRLQIPLPTVEEQIHISEYLDRETDKINTIISEAKASIEEYKTWKASIIYEAVTKGLDPNAEMEESGVPWIGKIPAHWRISRIKNEMSNLDYMREPISAENRDNKLGLFDYYGASGAIDKIDDYNVDDTVLLIGEDGANLRMRNLPLVYRASGKFWVNNHAHILKVNSNNNYGYMAYLLETGDYTVYITGAAQPKLSQFNLMRFPIPMAPRDEQDDIETYLDARITKIDSAIVEKEALIADLECYKKSLIFEAVTGKRRVC